MNDKTSIRNRQFFLAALVLIGMIVMGGLFQLYMDYIKKDVDSTVNQNSKIDQHFNAGIDYMLNKQFSQAAIEWQQILLITKKIPEVHVNLGFSLIEEKNYQQAADHFLTAMDLNAFQANAYYGLAVCYEKLGDLKAAMGSMRSYIHLSKEGDPFVRKARSALWEWENPLDQPIIKNQQSTESNQ